MGTWGPNLYQDDIADDVRTYYTDQLKQGKSNENITQELINDNIEAINDTDEASIFWFALADTQWKYGRLLQGVKEKALYYLDSGTDIQRWERENPAQTDKRRQILNQLRQKLNSEQPPVKKISQPHLYRCEWKNGDVFAYLLESDLTKTCGLYGRYVLLIKVDDYVWYPGHIIPIVRLKITLSTSLPKDQQTIEDIEYLPTWGKKGNSCDPHEYMMKIISTSKKIVPRKLIHLGCFPDLRLPKSEVIETDKISIIACHWTKYEDKIIELYMRYCY